MSLYETQKRKYASALYAELPDKELFGPSFQEFCDKWIQTLTGSKQYQLVMSFDKKDDTVACTDGRIIYVNLGHEMVQFYHSQENRFNTVLGLLFHECGHINDAVLLEAFRAAAKKIEEGKPLIPFDQNFTEVEQEVYDAFSDNDLRPLVHQLVTDVQNIGLDAHDEAAMTNNFNEYIGHCLTVSLAIDEATTPTLQQMRKDGKKEFDIVMSLLFQYTRFGKFVMDETEEAWEDPAIKRIFEMSTPLELLRISDFAEERNKAAFDVLVNLWPLLKEEIEKLKNPPPPQQQNQQPGNQQQNGGSAQSGNAGQSGQRGQNSQQGASSSSGGQGSSQQSSNGRQNAQQSGSPSQGQQQSAQSGMSTASAASQLAQQVAQASAGMKSKLPDNLPSSKKQLKANPAGAAPQKNGGKQNATQGNSQSGNDSAAAAAKSAFEQFKKALCQTMAEEKLETEAESATNNEIQIIAAQNACSAHKGRKIQVVQPKLSSTHEAEYRRKLKMVKPFSDRLAREMKSLFEELRQGSILRRRNFGRVDGKSLTRIDTDGRIFSQKKNPLDIPDMAICLLIDQSASMSSFDRKNASELAAILLEDFAAQLDIPIMVCGHNTCSGGIHFYVHRDFKTVDKRRKYSLASLETAHCNRDGYAVYVASELLGRRPEEDKLLFIISDGQPNDDDYGGEMAAEDIRQIVRTADRQYGIVTIAAAIGDDRDRIKSIYKTGFLNISDLSKLPKMLTNIVRERLEP